VDASINERPYERMGLTEVTDEMCLRYIRCPLSVNHFTALLDVEAHLIEPSGEVLIPALVSINSILPLLKSLVAVSDSRDERLKVTVELQHRSSFKVGCVRHFSGGLAETKTSREIEKDNR